MKQYAQTHLQQVFNDLERAGLNPVHSAMAHNIIQYRVRGDMEYLPSHKIEILTFHSGAGTNPKHIESIGPESGWVEFTIGAMSTPGQIMTLDFKNWQEIESVYVEYLHSNGSEIVSIKPLVGPKAQFVGIKHQKRLMAGIYGRFSYTVKLKRA